MAYLYVDSMVVWEDHICLEILRSPLSFVMFQNRLEALKYAWELWVGMFINYTCI